VRFVKDNRLLPRGFDKARASADIAVRGEALTDDTFGAGLDRVSYRVPLGSVSGPIAVEAELLYQPIAFRWAHNLRQQRGAEIDRFVGMFDAMASSSATRLAAASVEIRGATAAAR
jgi:hypothetical protein